MKNSNKKTGSSHYDKVVDGVFRHFKVQERNMKALVESMRVENKLVHDVALYSRRHGYSQNSARHGLHRHHATYAIKKV
jgi:hypothetical protein